MSEDMSVVRVYVRRHVRFNVRTDIPEQMLYVSTFSSNCFDCGGDHFVWILADFCQPRLISGAFTNSLCLDSRADEATAMGPECKGEST